MNLNERLSTGVHVEPDGLAWRQLGDGRLEVLEEYLNRGGVAGLGDWKDWRKERGGGA